MHRAAVFGMIGVLAAVAVGAAVLLSRPRAAMPQVSGPASRFTVSATVQSSYQGCRAFVLQKLLGPDGGVYTNYLNVPSSGDMTRGHDVLAESQGLLMLYAVRTGDRALFDKAWGYVKKHMLPGAGGGLVAWRVVNSEPAQSNATVDDLRIAGALCEGAERFHDKSLLAPAGMISSALLKTCVQSGYLTEGRGFDTAASPTVRLSYLDLGAMRRLAALDSRWQAVADSSAKLLQKGAVGGQAPLWPETYDITTGRFEQTARYDMVGSLLTLQALADSGADVSGQLRWIAEKFQTGPLYAAYDETGAPVSSMQSTAIYALVMLLAYGKGDKGLYLQAEQRLAGFQVVEQGSPVTGAFGSMQTQEVYSFDNLLALLALHS